MCDILKHTMASLSELKKEMNRLANARHAKTALWFFKTGPGEYGEGDRFIGIRGPMLRKLSKKYRDLAMSDVKRLLTSPIHEMRQVGLFILVLQFERGDTATRKKIYNLYLKHTKFINNWDLVDLSAPNIVGMYLLDKPRAILYRLARSQSLWERRIAMLATFAFIRHNDFTDALKIASLLRTDEHDLMHKAVGWMLREIGKRNLASEERWLRTRYQTLPRTMLRYAIEKFPEPKRKKYLAGTI